MKISLIAILLTLVTSLCHAKAYKFRSYEYYEVSPGKGRVKDSVNALITINMDNKRVDIYDNGKFSLDIVEKVGDTTTNTSENGETRIFTFSAVDDNGKERKMDLALFTSPTTTIVGALTLFFENGTKAIYILTEI